MSSSTNWLNVIASAGYSAKTVMYSLLGLFILSSVITAAEREKLFNPNLLAKHCYLALL